MVCNLLFLQYVFSNGVIVPPVDGIVFGIIGMELDRGESGAVFRFFWHFYNQNRIFGFFEFNNRNRFF